MKASTKLPGDRTASLLLSVLSIAWLASCGTEGGGTGGAAGLPNRGVQAYQLVELDTDGDPETDPSPWVLAPGEGVSERWHSPTAAVVDGRLTAVWVVDADNGTQRIVLAASEDRGRTWSTPRPLFGTANVGTLLDPDTPPEDVVLQGPALLVGDQQHPWLIAFGLGQGAGIGLARSPDGGVWTVDETLYLKAAGTEEEIRSPSLVRTDLGLELFYEALLKDGRRVIRRAVEVVEPGASDEELPTVKLVRRGTVLGPPQVDCIDAFSEIEKCWDADGVGAPEVRWAKRRSDGSHVYRMWYAGYSSTKGDLGFAASFDGQVWSRHPTNPAIETNGAEDEPTNVVLGDAYLLLYTNAVKTNQPAISLSVDTNGAPAEMF